MLADYTEKDLLARLDGMVKTNLDLISHRMGWLLVSQSFLFTGVALAAAHRDSPIADRKAIDHLLDLLPVIGLFTCFMVGTSIAAAILALWQIKGTRSRLEHALIEAFGHHFGPSSVPRSSLKDWIGHLPALIAPMAFALGWIYVLFL